MMPLCYFFETVELARSTAIFKSALLSLSKSAPFAYFIVTASPLH